MESVPPGVGGRWRDAAFRGGKGLMKAAATGVRSAKENKESTLAYAEHVPVRAATRVLQRLDLILEV